MLKRTRTKLTEDNTIMVDGVPVAVQWNDVRTGTSFFIPCTNPVKVKKEVQKHFARLEWRMWSSIRVENDYYGIRIWRIL